MILRNLLVQFYCLRLSDSILLLLTCSAVFCLAEKKLSARGWWHWATAVLLLALMTAVVYSTVGYRSGNNSVLPQLVPFHSYREVMNGGHPEIYRSNFMNAALFYPAGLLGTVLLPEKWRGWCRCLLVTVLLCAVSAGIEYLQYRYALGLCEIDDVIHNTAGALAGSIAAVLIPRTLEWLREKDLL